MQKSLRIMKDWPIKPFKLSLGNERSLIERPNELIRLMNFKSKHKDRLKSTMPNKRYYWFKLKPPVRKEGSDVK